MVLSRDKKRVVSPSGGDRDSEMLQNKTTESKWTFSLCPKNCQYLLKLCESHVWLFATPTDCNLSGSSVHGIFQVRILEWFAISFSINTFYFLIFCSLLHHAAWNMVLSSSNIGAKRGSWESLVWAQMSLDPWGLSGKQCHSHPGLPASRFHLHEKDKAFTLFRLLLSWL